MLQDTLASIELFSELSADEIARIAEVGRVEYWAEGAVVIEEGAHGPRLMVLLDGEVEVLRRDPTGVQRTLGKAGPGEVLGEMSLLLELPRTATVQALSELRVFAMDQPAFQDLVDDGDPAVLKLGLALSRMLAGRVLRLSERVTKLLMQADSKELQERFTQARQEVFKLWDPDG